MNLSSLFGLISILYSCAGQVDDDRGLLFNRRKPSYGGGTPCGYRSDYEDDTESRTLLAVVGGAAVGGLVGGAAGYHLGMKNQRPVVINNNVYNKITPCVSSIGDGGSGVSSGSVAGSGGGILSNHPILSNLLSGDWLQGIGGNRNVRQFRRVVRPISRLL